MSSIADLVAKLVIKGDSSSAVRELSNLEKKVNATNQVIQRLDRGLRTIQAVTAGGLVAIGGALTVIAREGNNAWGEVEDLNRSLTTLLKSKGEANRATAEIMKFAGSAPFKISEINEASKYLLANGATVEQLTDKYRGLLRVFGDVAATMSSKDNPLSITELAQLYERAQQGQMRANMLLRMGLTKADLARYGARFDDAGQIVKQMGLPTEEAMQNVADALVNAFRDKFSGGMARLATDDEGLLQVIKNRVKNLLTPMGEEIDKQWESILGIVRDGLEELAADPEIAQGLTEIVSTLSELAKPIIRDGIEYIGNLIKYLKENPQALSDAILRLVGTVKALGAVLLTVIGVRGLMWLITTFGQVVVAGQAVAIFLNSSLIPAFARLITTVSASLIPALLRLGAGFEVVTTASAATSAAASAMLARLAPLAASVLGPMASRMIAMGGGMDLATTAASGLSLGLGTLLSRLVPLTAAIGGYVTALGKMKEGQKRAAQDAADVQQWIADRQPKWIPPVTTPFGVDQGYWTWESYPEWEARKQLESTPEWVATHDPRYAPPPPAPPPPPSGGSTENQKREREFFAQTGAFSYPVADYQRWKVGGYAKGSHRGIDVMAEAGTEIYAPVNAIIRRISKDDGTAGGNRIWIQTGDGKFLYFAHMQSFAPGLKADEPVNAGALLGYVGNTGGRAGQPWTFGKTPSHLHFSVSSKLGEAMSDRYTTDPRAWLAQVQTGLAPVKGAQDPLQDAIARASEEVEQARRKLALYREGVERGTVSQAKLDEVQTELRETQAKLYEQLRTRLTNDEFARVQQAAPELIADLFQAWNDQQNAARLTEATAGLTETFNKTKEKFDTLNAQVEALRGALRSLEDSYAGLRSARARAQGHGLEALAIDADSAMRGVYRGIEDVERYRSENEQKLAEQDTQAVAQETQLLAQLASAMQAGYAMVESLRGTEGGGGLAGELMAALEPLYQQWAPEIDAQQAIAGDVLLNAGYELKAAAAALQAAASALQGAYAAAAAAGAAAGQAAIAGAQNLERPVAGAMPAGVTSGAGTAFIPGSYDSYFSAAPAAASNAGSPETCPGGTCGGGGSPGGNLFAGTTPYPSWADRFNAAARARGFRTQSFEERYAGQGLPTGGAEQQQAQDAGKQGGQSMLGSFLSGLQDAARLAGEAVITGDWQAAKQALGQALAGALKNILNSVVGGLGPIGGVIGAFGGGLLDGLVKKLFGKHEPVQHVIVDNVVRTLPDNLNYTLAAHPGSSLLAGRAFATGASYAQPAGGTVVIKAAAGLGDLIDVTVSRNLRLQLDNGAVRP